MDQSLKDFFIEYNHNRLLKVLLVDDDKIVQRTSERLFVICGFKVDVAYDGLQAIDMAMSAFPRYDFILMDIHMPTMDGIQATREIKRIREYESVPVFALTGDMSMDAKLQVVSAGMREYFNKPVDMDQVLTTIKSYL